MPRDVIVYTTPLCAPCERLKSYLRAKGVPFIVKDVMVDEEAAEFLESRHIYSAPVLSVDGELVMGFQRERVDELLGL